MQTMDPEIDQLFQKMFTNRKDTPVSLMNRQKPTCPKCSDVEFIITDEGAYPCECRAQKQIQRNIKSSMMDKSFLGASFDNFKSLPHTKKMLITAREYAASFSRIKPEPANGLMFMAKVGELTIKDIKNLEERVKTKEQHNSYGLGKTHLLSAIANTLLPQGVQVAIVNDKEIMAELRQGQFADETDYFENLIHRLESVELLIWDDLGKEKTTDWVLNQYYRIFNSRYRSGLPVCISTNEDIDSLAERVGDATASRLYAICKPRLVLCEGPDYRLR